MERFTTSDGKQFILKINIGAAFRVKEKTGFNILNPAEAQNNNNVPLIGQILTDDLILSEIVAAIIAPQLEDNKTSLESFYNSLDGGALLSVQSAFLSEYRNFFTERGAVPLAQLVEEAQARLAETMKA